MSSSNNSLNASSVSTQLSKCSSIALSFGTSFQPSNSIKNNIEKILRENKRQATSNTLFLSRSTSTQPRKNSTELTTKRIGVGLSLQMNDVKRPGRFCEKSKGQFIHPTSCPNSGQISSKSNSGHKKFFLSASSNKEKREQQQQLSERLSSLSNEGITLRSIATPKTTSTRKTPENKSEERRRLLHMSSPSERLLDLYAIAVDESISRPLKSPDKNKFFLRAKRSTEPNITVKSSHQRKIADKSLLIRDQVRPSLQQAGADDTQANHKVISSLPLESLPSESTLREVSTRYHLRDALQRQEISRLEKENSNLKSENLQLYAELNSQKDYANRLFHQQHQPQQQTCLCSNQYLSLQEELISVKSEKDQLEKLMKALFVRLEKDNLSLSQSLLTSTENTFELSQSFLIANQTSSINSTQRPLPYDYPSSISHPNKQISYQKSEVMEDPSAQFLVKKIKEKKPVIDQGYIFGPPVNASMSSSEGEEPELKFKNWDNSRVWFLDNDKEELSTTHQSLK